MAEELAPPVVAVVVTNEPGEYLESCLGSLRSQDYPNLTVLVVDDASSTELTSRVAAVAPAAIIRRRERRGGFATAANEALRGVEGAAFLLFCHDDVILAPEAVRLLVEGSFRLNAGVVGPKYVRVDDPSRLLQVGLGVHRLGTTARRVEPGELDQSQHDEAREVFVAPGGAVLVRADLFAALGGFDPAISHFGEDLDLCWRAQVAGARVAVSPDAVVRHHELAASGRREVGDAALLARRHELRATLKNYGRWRRPVIVAELLAVSIAEILVSLIGGERDRARRVLAVWRWNLAEHASLREGRRRLRRLRQVPDRLLVRRMVGRGRIARVLRPTLPAETPGVSERLTTWWARIQRGDLPTGQLIAVTVLVLVAIVALRDVAFSRSPLFGQLVRMPTGTSMLSQYVAGLDVGGRLAPAPSAFLPVGLLGVILGNSTAMALKAIALASVGLGAIGVSRFCRPFASSRGRIVAAASFLALPILWNSLARADVSALVALGLLPFLLTRLARASRLTPFAPARTDGSGRPLVALAGEGASCGLLLAALVALAPPAALDAGVLLAVVVASCLLSGRPGAAVRVAGVAGVAGAVAFLCCLPWSAGWLVTGARWSAFSGAVPVRAVLPAALLRGHLGPVGGWWGSWGIAAAALFALVVGRRERARWAATCLFAGVSAAALAWAGSEGWLGAGGGASLVLAAPIGVSAAICCGLGVSVLEQDVVRRAELGWQQAAGALAGLSLAVGLFPALTVAAGGRADLPPDGVAVELDLAPQVASRHFQALWIGDPGALPGAGWQLSRGLSFYLARGLPTARQDWPAASPGRLGAIGRALEEARSGRTADLGSLLAPFGIRYLVVTTADAPETAGSAPPLVAPPPRGLISLLGEQNDLVPIPIEAGARLFKNADWSDADGAGTRRALGVPPPPGSSATMDADVAVALASVLLALAVTAVRRRRVLSSRGEEDSEEPLVPALDSKVDTLPLPDPVAVGVGLSDDPFDEP